MSYNTRSHHIPRLLVLLAAIACSRAPAPSTIPPQAGLVTVASAFTVDSTLSRLTAALARAGLRVAARIDHAAAAQSVGLTLGPTVLVIAGNPAAGTPLMQRDQRVAIDLPLKFLVWRDPAGRVYVGYNSIEYVVARHGLTAVDEVRQRIAQTQASVVAEAAGK